MNTIRTPRLGLSATSRRIAQAVDDEGWQEFRLSLKGISTQDKLQKLVGYYNAGKLLTDDTVYIRVDNYLKALARGGQIAPEASTDYVAKLMSLTLTIRK